MQYELAGREAQAEAALVSGDWQKAIANMNGAVRIEDSIYALSQPPYPPIPAHELYGIMLLGMNRPAQARHQFTASLKRTPGRPRAILGLARSAQLLGDNQTAAAEYKDFIEIWKNADQNLPEIPAAKRFLASTQIGTR